MSTGPRDEDLDLIDYIRALKRRWVWILVPLVAVLAAAAWYSTSRPVVYAATARVLLDDSAAREAVDDRLENTGVRSRELANRINLAESDRAAEIVAQRLGLESGAPLPDGAITAKSDSDVLEFRFRGSTAESAAVAANTWADVFVELNQEAALGSITEARDRLGEQVDELRAERATLTSNLRGLEARLTSVADEEERANLQARIDRERGAISGDLNLIDAQIEANVQGITQLQLTNDVQSGGIAWVFQTAVPASAPLNRSLARNLLIGAVLGAVIGSAIALVRDQLDRSITGADDLEALGLAFLGSIPRASRQDRRGLDKAESLASSAQLSDAHQKVRSALQFVALGNSARCILITSPTEANGKTTTAVGLALAFAGVDRRVVLVDADFRRPRIHTIFGTELVPGVSDALVRGISLERIAVATTPAERASLAALPAGTEPPNPTAFLAARPYSNFIEQIKRESDISVIDAPPILPLADATSLAPLVDGVVLVAEAGRTTSDDLQAAADIVERAGGRLLGVVISRVRVRGRSSYGYGSDRPQNDRPPARPVDTNGVGDGPNGAPVVADAQVAGQPLDPGGVHGG